jgi:hypothetical protein
VKELKEVVQHGRPPIAAKPRAEERRVPEVEERGGPQKIHKDIMGRKTIKEAAGEASRPSLPPPAPHLEKREPRLPTPRPPDSQAAPSEVKKQGQPHLPRQFELGKKPPGQPGSAQPLYREPPKPGKKPVPVVPEKPRKQNKNPGEKEGGKRDDKQE